MRIVIKSSTVHGEDRTDTNGKGYRRLWQDAFFESADETLKVRVPVESEARGYAPGEYTFASASFVRNKYQNLELGRVILEPLKAAGK